MWQRPQQVLSRLACHAPVLYVNEPRLATVAGPDVGVETIVEGPRLTALQPVYADRPHVLARWRELHAQVVSAALHRRGWTSSVCAWFYTPTPVAILDSIRVDVVVYDVMDELANFKGAAADLRLRDERLLQRADVVFAGGRSLWEDRRRRRGDVHLVPSGVDASHYQARRDPAPEVAMLPSPVLGYVGVVDERLDLELLDRLAAARPYWSIVLVGPVIKVDPADLPRRPNIHYLGSRPYKSLPAFTEAFDVCLMPFALNAATRFISPTKALEYMAARRPVVSTSVPDVVSTWGHVVEIADHADAFLAAIERVLHETPARRSARLSEQARLVARSSWDDIAERMWESLGKAAGTNAEVA